MNHTNSSKIRRNYVWQFAENPQLQIRFSPFKPSLWNRWEPRLFLKLNYRTKFPCKNNHKTDPCFPVQDQKIVFQTLVLSKYNFSTWYDFLTFFDTKKECLPTIETSVISSLDIPSAAPRKKTRLIFLMSAEKCRETRNYYQHESNNRARHCSSRDDDSVTYQCATLHIRKYILIGSLKNPSIGSELYASR